MIKIDEFIQRAKSLEANYNKIIAKPQENMTPFERMVLHEIGTKANAIMGFYHLLEEGDISNKEFETKYLAKMINPLRLSEKIINLAEIKSFKKSNLFSENEISAKVALKELIKPKEGYLKKNNIQIKFIGNDGETNIKPSVLYSLLGTLVGNALKFTIPDSQINLFVRTYKDNFLMEIENYHDSTKPQRLDIGLGKGLGKEFSDRIIKTLNGKITQYDKPFFMSHDTEKNFYGVRIKIPKANSRLENLIDEDEEN